MSEMRWNPILQEWVVTATHRQDRTFFPPRDYCPLDPTKPGGIPTEVPAPDYQIVTFENRFPAFQRTPPPPAVEPTELYRVRPSQGVCEVVLYTPEHEGTLTDASVAQIYRLIRVWTDRYAELGRLDFVRYVLIFENKGAVIGVTLTHPHGQIYAFPFIPPILQRELASGLQHMERTGRCLFCDVLDEELRDGRRLVAESEQFIAFIPFFARWPYEVHIYSRIHAGSLLDFGPEQQYDLARLLKVVLLKYDGLWQISMPYIMVVHQQPTDGGVYPHYHFHVEFYPPHRTKEKLKYLAGVESGSGTFLNDTLPEDKAAELRAVPPLGVADLEA